MMIQTNTTDRKALAQAIAEELHTEARYLRTPTYAYEVGEFTIDRDGNIVGDDFTPLMGFLLRSGYITEDALAAQAGSVEAPVQAIVLDEASMGEAAMNAAENMDADFGEDQQAEATVSTNSIDEQIITISAPDITVEQLRNLTYILYSRQHILNLMAGGSTICIPEKLIEALKESLPYTLEDFTSLLDSFRGSGLKGFDFKADEFSLTFPFYETEPARWTAFAGLQGRILKAACEAKRVFPELIQPDQEAEKYTAHTWLQRLGYSGPEMKEQRNILLKHLHGYCAFANGAKMQKHKERFTAIRRERREAERAAADAVASEEVTGND